MLRVRIVDDGPGALLGTNRLQIEALTRQVSTQVPLGDRFSRLARGLVAAQVALQRDVHGDGEEDRVVPDLLQLWPLQEDAVDKQHRIGERFLTLRESRRVRHEVEDAHTVPAISPWPQGAQELSEQCWIIK